MESGELIRATRVRRGLTRQRLALRTGIGLPVISRLERGETSPTVRTIELILNAMGERLELTSAPLERRYDTVLRRAFAALPVEERLKLAIAWNRTAGQIKANQQAKRAPRPEP